MTALKKILKDPAIWTLLALNLYFINEFVEDPRQYTTIIWLYWCQSVLFGVFNFVDMLTLRNVNVEGLTINDKPATARQAKGCLPIFFLVHYNAFHIAYFVFLLTMFKVTDVDFPFLKLALLGILLNLIIVFVQHKIKYSYEPANISKMFFMPYLRIIPMHLTILLPEFIGWSPALLFLVLKTIFDVIGHLATTPYYWSKKQPVPEGGYI